MDKIELNLSVDWLLQKYLIKNEKPDTSLLSTIIELVVESSNFHLVKVLWITGQNFYNEMHSQLQYIDKQANKFLKNTYQEEHSLLVSFPWQLL